MKISPTQPILLVEDSPEDQEACVRALRAAGLANPIHHCADGDEALDYLFHRGAYAPGGQPAPRPGIILLDLNLPGTDGRDVLDEVKRDASLKTIPVVVLTTSSSETDVDQCYRAGANTYVTKPVDLQRYMEALGRLKDYWFEIAVLPKVPT